jgi:hypothetical protein
MSKLWQGRDGPDRVGVYEILNKFELSHGGTVAWGV